MGSHIRFNKGAYDVRMMVNGRMHYQRFKHLEYAQIAVKRLEIAKDLGKLGEDPPESSMRLEAAGELWLDTMATRLAETTLASYTYRWNANIVPILGSQRLKFIKPADVEDLITRRVKEGATPNDADHDRMMLSSFFTWAAERELVRQNPCKRVKKLRFAPTRGRRALSDDEVLRVTEALAPVSRLTFLLAVYTGMRASELRRLSWDDVDLERHRVHVVSRGRLHTKNYQGRHVPLHPKLEAELVRAPRRGRKVVGSFKGLEHGADFRGIIEQAVAATKIPPFRWHDLRHTMGTRLRRAGVSLEDIAAILGHKDLKSTLIYAHENDDDLAAGVARLK